MRHARAGGEVGQNGREYEGGQFMPDENSIGLGAAKPAKHAKPATKQRFLVTEEFAEANMLPHGVTWEYSIKSAQRKQKMLTNADFDTQVSIRPDWHGRKVCYVYLTDIAKIKEFWQMGLLDE
jgi:hypothetical protein